MAKWISVKDRLPEESGDYFCLRYGMHYPPEVVHFDAANDEDSIINEFSPCWHDTFGHQDGGGCNRVPYHKLSDKNKYWRDNHGIVTHWYPSPERPDLDSDEAYRTG